MLTSLLLVAHTALAGAPVGFTPGVEGQTGFGPPVADADGAWLALTRWDRAGLWSLDLGSHVLRPVSDARGAGFHPVWDSRLEGHVTGPSLERSLLFKAVYSEETGGRAPGQYAMEWRPDVPGVSLLGQGAHVGQPTRSGSLGSSMWTGPSAVRFTNEPAWRARLADIADVDLIDADPAGERVAWDDPAGVLHVRDLTTGVTRALDSAGRGSHPAWSPDGAMILHHTADGIVVVDAQSGSVVAVARGRDPAWVPDTHTVLFASVQTGDDVGPGAAPSPYVVLSSTLQALDADSGRTRTVLADPSVHARYPTPLGRTGAVAFVDTITGDLWRLTDSGRVRLLAASEVDAAAPPPPPSNARVEVDVPYMHQLWDTPDDFNGGWSCGPTSCMQTLAKWSVLPNADITCSWPSAHTSHWGWYIPNTYSFNGYTYDVWGVAAGGDCQGAHGFICREYGGAVWAYMTAFMQQHGVDSQQLSADFNNVVSEVNAGYPLYASVDVLGYGHIISVRGYVTQDGAPIHTMVVNDPYGNAGTGDWGNDDGEDIVYDWPGYNNGNLEIDVSALFSAHGTAPPDPDTGTAPVDTGTPPVDTGTVTPPADTGNPGTPDGDGSRAIPPAGQRVIVDGIGGCQTAPRGVGWVAVVAGLALVRRRRGR